MNLETEKNELPYIQDPHTNFKILIDTGSTKSFIKKFLGFECFKNNIINENFEVTTAHGTSKEKYSVTCPFLGHRKSKFYLFDFHEDFDMLLGLDNIKNLCINLDFINNKLLYRGKEIPICYYDTEANEYGRSANKNINNNNENNNNNSNRVNSDNSKKIVRSYNIEARTSRIIKIKVANMTNGEGLLAYRKINELEVPCSIIKVENGEGLCTITNPTTKNKIINIIDPVKIDDLNDYNIFTINQLKQFKRKINFNLIGNKPIELDLSKIRTEHMSSEERKAIINLIKEYADIFHVEGNDLTFTNQIKHVIRTKDELPIYTRSYKYPEVYKKEVNRQVGEMLQQKIIQPSCSPWNSPIWVVPKKRDASGKSKFRLVIDFRALNAKTIDDKFPLPNINDILDKLGRSQYFTTLDLASGFHQVEMDSRSIEKTAFSTETGHYEFLRMPFGLKNSPPTFQRVMNNILRGIHNEICLVYLDDIIIYSTSLIEHVERLREVFNRLRNANFKVQLDKTEFLRKEVAYLGHVVTPQGVKPNPDKILAIKNYPIPKTITEIKAFLGLLGYYRRFIKNFADITKPLTKRLKKNTKINIEDKDYENSFQMCKNILSNEPLLQYPDFNKEFRLTTDASNVAVGAILSQIKDGADLPIAYASRTLNVSECNLSTIEKELLAIVWATKYFRPYLYGRKFKVITDHKPLTWLFSIKEPNSKLLRWRLKLEEYNYDIEYKKGKLNQNADALSRIQLNNNTSNLLDYNSSDSFDEQDASQIISAVLEKHFPDKDVRSILANVDETEENLEMLHDNEIDTVHSNYDGNTTAEIPISEEPVNYAKNQIILSLVKYNPKKVKRQNLFNDSKTRLIVEISSNNFENDVIKFVKEYLVPKVKYSIFFEDDFYERFAAIITQYFKNSELNLIRCTNKILDVTTVEEVNEVINNYHVGKTNHRGVQETYEKIKRRYYWPNMKNDIRNNINQCENCLKVKYDRVPLKLEINLTPTANRPLQIIHIDSITLDKTKFLTIIDTFSRYVQIYKIVGAQGVEIANKLLNYFSQFGVPEIIVSDNGGEFNNYLIKELMDVHKIKIHFTSTQNPSSNGITERFHSTLVEHVRLLGNRPEFKGESIGTKVKYAILAYNNSIHSVTKLTPFEVLFGHINTNSFFDIDINKQIANDYVDNHVEKTKRLYEHIREVNQTTKEKVLEKRNFNKEKLPEIPTDVYVRNNQKQNKTKNKYNKETVQSVNKDLKTAKIIPRHHNTKNKIHLSKIKRPKKGPFINAKLVSDPVPGPSCS